MLLELYDKIRALVGDALPTPGFEIFEYTTTNIFTIASQNITITSVLINGTITSDYTFNVENNKITVSASGLTSSDKIEVDFINFKYSTLELKEYIRAALTWISIFGGDEKDFEIETDFIVPTPDNPTEDLIAIIASILIKPNIVRKSLPGGITVVYPKMMSKEKVIEQLIVRYNRGIGVTGIISL